MSGFQTYLDGAQAQTGITPRAFLELARSSGRAGAKPSEIIEWLKNDYGLGHGYAANLAQLITKGPDAIAAKYNGGRPLRLDGTGSR